MRRRQNKQAKDLWLMANDLLDSAMRPAAPTTEAEEDKHAVKTFAKKRKQQDEPEIMVRKWLVADFTDLAFTDLAEALLCFHAWYKLGAQTLDNDGKFHRRCHTSRKTRKKGNGRQLRNVHDILHLAVDMERFGPPKNFDTRPHECINDRERYEKSKI
jgi:hypothetical protein